MDELMGIVKPFCGNFAPRGWKFCDGSLLSISQNSALYAILGTIYGGDGITTFALPDLRGRIAIEANSTNVPLGLKAGTENVTITSGTFASHSHVFNGLTGTRETNTPGNNYLGIAAGNFYCQFEPGDQLLPMNANTVTAAPGNYQPHNNMAPFLAINYVICVEGVFPSRN